MTPDDRPDVTDDTAAHRFVVEIDRVEAHLVYEVEDDLLFLIHTEVPDELGGHGLGGTLVRAALARAAADGLTIVPWCPFARTWLEDHPGEAATVSIDWETLPPRR